MLRLTHARQGIPWAVVAAVSAPGIALVLVALVWRSSAWSLEPLQAGTLLLAVPAAFLLDDPLAPAVESLPRTPGWYLSARLLGWVPSMTLVAGSTWWWAHGRGAGQTWLLFVTPWVVMVVATAAAALARRLGRHAPGDLVASVIAMSLLGLWVFCLNPDRPPLRSFWRGAVAHSEACSCCCTRPKALEGAMRRTRPAWGSGERPGPNTAPLRNQRAVPSRQRD
jgi:hypothetical protein